ncbi:PREDICTED: uncharacterized protein LOC109207583 [Nicotiana attenuata]|uniref:uncharacterized protein LOC109207583 n=1 Tax=Nicotiana attenuata TaxID=49451 RepID=UPI000905C6D7|nr:PREDICTED: uncharacterized protein LOC109207583 [Nicotiana attenuata]
MDNGDKSWMNLLRWTDEYIRGVNDFLDKAFERAAQGNEILCPCKKCMNLYWYYRNVVEDHLVVHGFVDGYTKWVFHREGFSSRNTPHPSNDDEGSTMCDDIDGLLHDTFRNIEVQAGDEEGVGERLSEDAKKFFKLLEEGKQELYPGCENFSKLSFTIRLYLLKSLHGLSNMAFSDLLELIKEAFPFAQVPESFNKARNMITDLGLHYEKIHACPNDCMLFWKENANAENCSICGSSRWKSGGPLTKASSKIPAKVLRYFPLKPRLQRIFMCPETAAAMRWHANERPNDGNIRHPADGEAWKAFDSLHPDFSRDARNVRLGLSSDGFNPFRTMSISHSTWPVMLMNYNLSPWICMKPEYIMLSMIIPGPSSPGNDIDVYLRPLIEELKELWETGIDTFDAETNQTFRMRAALMWTVSDFPALAMLSGWSTKGRLACPTCNYDTCSQYLKHSHKMCYLGHRRFLPRDHPFRRDKKSFDGKEEHRPAPAPLSGEEVFEELLEFNNIFGKRAKKRPRSDKGPWKKRSIFFELPYWVHNKLRHNLDVMHIEKNICDSLLGTLLEIDGKSKDHEKSRYDLQEMGIRKELQPRINNDGTISLAKSCFYMEPKQKSLFCTVMKNAKLPKGCASNISERVQVKEMKISGYKSHDAHFIMHYLLQVAVRKVLPKNVSLALIRLGNFFRAICSKVIRRKNLETMQSEIVEITCELEKIFHPTFFDIMPHLPIHLVNEIKLGGPAHLRWMYPIERNLCKYKAFVRNRSSPEASIAEGFLADECLTFCSRYLHDGVKTKFSRYQTVDDECSQNLSPIFPNIGHPIGSKKKNTFLMDSQLCFEAHRYALFNTGDEQMEKFIEEHKNLIVNHSRSNAWVRARDHSREFSNWFKEKVKNIVLPDYLRWLANGPNIVAKRYTGYFINGYQFHTKERDSRGKTQNSGVTLSATSDSFASARDQNPIDGEVIYYGAIKDIIEIDYWGSFSVVLFRCDWFRNEIDDYGLTRVYFNRLCSTDDPFVLASQVYQVFYVEDPIEKDVYYARSKVPVDLYDLEEENCPNIGDTFWREPNNDIGSSSILLDDDVRWSREDVPIDIIDIPSHAQNSHDTIGETSEEEDGFDGTDWDWMEADD